MTFHIVYTPGTVRPLALFLRGLLAWSDCSFRLVANGCSRRERDFLASLCRGAPRLSFLALPWRGMASHGKALTFLQSREESEYFCFLDPDILATGPFIEEMRGFIEGHDALFSCPPLWCRRDELVYPPGEKRVIGSFNATADGRPLGGTYFAIYRNAPLSALIRETGIGFAWRRLRDVPAPLRGTLMRICPGAEIFDTGKVLNILWADRGGRLVFRRCPALIHLGGVAAGVAMGMLPLPGREQHPRELLSLGLRRLLGRLASIRRTQGVGGVARRLLCARDPRLPPQVLLASGESKRLLVAGYFARLLGSLNGGFPPPAAPRLGNAEVDDRIAAATSAIVSAFAEFGAPAGAARA